MKKKIYNFLFILLFTILFAGCNDSKQTNSEAKEKPSQSDLKTDKQPAANKEIDLQAPDLANPELKKYYSDFTDYIKKVVTSIRNKDEAGTMKLFREEGTQFDNSSTMEAKVRTSPEEEQKFTTWFIQSIPLSQEIVRSDYYKKFNDEYYKKVKEKVKAIDKK